MLNVHEDLANNEKIIYSQIQGAFLRTKGTKNIIEIPELFYTPAAHLDTFLLQICFSRSVEQLS